MENEEQYEIQEEPQINRASLENDQPLTLEDIIQAFIIQNQSPNEHKLITQQSLFHEILSHVSLDASTQKELQIQINLLFQNKDPISISELSHNFNGDSLPQEQQPSKQQGSAHKVNVSDLNLLDQEIPKELIDFQKPFANIEKQQNHNESNNNNNNGGIMITDIQNENNNNYEHEENEYETLIKPSNNFAKLYGEENIDNEIENENMEQHPSQIENISNNENEDYINEEIVYPINKQKKTFLHKENEYISSLNQSRDKDFAYKHENDFFMNVFQNASSNKKKLKCISDKVNKLYDSNVYNDNRNKQKYYALSLKNMGKTSQHSNLYLNTPSSLLSYKIVKYSKMQKQPNYKLSVERDKIFNEILHNAKQESVFISQRNVKSQKDIMQKYQNVSQRQQKLNDIEDRIVMMLAKNRNVEDGKESNNIEYKIAQQIKEMGGRIEMNDDNDKIEERINLNNVNVNNNVLENQQFNEYN